jgi:hypothetical protein
MMSAQIANRTSETKFDTVSEVLSSYHGLGVRLYRGATQRRDARDDNEERRPQEQNERRTVDTN